MTVYKKAQLQPYKPPGQGKGQGQGQGQGQGDGGSDADEVLDKHTDDHSKGGKDDVDTSKASEKDIEKQNEKVDHKVETGKDKDDSKDDKGSGGPGGSKDPGKGKGQWEEMKLNVRPTFNWKQIISRFVKKGVQTNTEEFYTKINKRAISSATMLPIFKSSAIKPGEVEEEYTDMNLAIVLDTSGSMYNAIPKLYAEAKNLLTQPMFKKTTVIVIQFNDDISAMYKVNFANNKSVEIKSVDEKTNTFNQKADYPFLKFQSGGTYFSDKLTEECSKLLTSGYNVLICSDMDIAHAQNASNVQKLTLSKDGKDGCFVLMADAQSYKVFKENVNIASQNISHF